VLCDELRYRSTTLRITECGNDTAGLVKQEHPLRSHTNGSPIYLNLVNRWIDLPTEFGNDLSIYTDASLFDELLHLSTGANTTFS
jgi:hypothetical protein